MFMQDDHHHHHHHQQQLYHHQELVLPCPPIRPILMDRRWKPNVELAPNCPRCDSSNTKFCYYNNYSLTQPRYFCKGCRRYWTKGGSLRNVPIGGGCRKNRRGKSVRISTNNRSSPHSTSNYEGGGDSSGGSLQGVNGVSRNESFGNLINNNAPPVTSIISSQRSDSSTATTTNNNATIDLALVYAKYLNQQPDCTNSRGSIIPTTTGPEVPRNHHQFGSSFEFVENPTHRLHKPSSQEQCMFGSSISNLIGSISNPSPGTHLSETKQVCLASHDQQHQPEMSSNYMFQAPLPPPSEDVSSALQDNLWLNSPNSMLTSSSFNWQSTPTQLQGFEPITGDHSTTTLHSNSLDGNWNSSFHLLPSYETFPGQ